MPNYRERLDAEHPEIYAHQSGTDVLITGAEREALLDEWAANLEASLWDKLREQRDALLAASDWTQVADAPVDAAAWAKYRQALRDLPAKTDDPEAVKWPKAPVS